MTLHCKKLIEVALPVKEISAESVRDKSIRHGHISTLHLWWARRPLPVCRAVIFASLVPDPLDEHCPQSFREALEIILGKENNSTDPYKPYTEKDSPSVSAMEDNLRNRLLMFIGKYSGDYIINEKNGKVTPAGKVIADSSLIKWESRKNEVILNKARALIFVAHNAQSEKSAETLIKEYTSLYDALRSAEKSLSSIPDRHKTENKIVCNAERVYADSLEQFLNAMPKVFDPFAGGGAIPLEASRLGCRSFGNDINPVAHIIQKGSAEFPQKYGKQIIYSRNEFVARYGIEEYELVRNADIHAVTDTSGNITIPNRLSYDVEYYAKKLLSLTETDIGKYYPADKKGNKPIAYYWARVAHCANPSCKVEIPLLRGFYLCNKNEKQVYLKPIIKAKTISFSIAEGECDVEGWSKRGNLVCPICGNTTDSDLIKEQSIQGKLKPKLIAVIEEGKESKQYRLPRKDEIDILDTLPPDIEVPTEKMQRNSAGGDTFSWGVDHWGQMFSSRQLLVLHTLVQKIGILKEELNSKEEEYARAVVTYLGILINRVSTRITSFGIWNTSAETLEHPFGRQAIPMVFDYPEANPFSQQTGGAASQLDWICRYIESECDCPFPATCINASSGDKQQFENKSLSSVITDPPYYDAIAYADLSDYFYVWFKRTIADMYPLNFSTPQTPKGDECTALKHHHENDAKKAELHFKNKLIQIFDAIERQTHGVISIMFAHQSTLAWSTLCDSILNSRMNITGSWAIDTERTGGVKGNKAFLSSSVTVACRPSIKSGIGDYQTIRKEIEAEIKKEVELLYRLGFRGADLLTACFGQAVSVFGHYERVEKADGSLVSVADLLEMARDSAFKAIVSDIDADEYTRFYIGWMHLFGFTPAEHDDLRRITQIGLNIDSAELLKRDLIVRENDSEFLASAQYRMKKHKTLGEEQDANDIDKVHRLIYLWQKGKRDKVVLYVAEVAPNMQSPLWRIITALAEVLPAGTDDAKHVQELLANRESVVRDTKNVIESNSDTNKKETIEVQGELL